MINHVVVKVTGKLVEKVEAVETLEEAAEALKIDFLKAFKDNGFSQEDYENGVGLGYIWEHYETFAWIDDDVKISWSVISL